MHKFLEHYAHPLTAEVKQGREWVEEYYQMLMFDELKHFFKYETCEGGAYPRGSRELLAFMVPVEIEHVDTCVSENRMRLR